MNHKHYSKWYDPFFRSKMIRLYGHKLVGESWTAYAKRVGAKLPIDIDKKKLNSMVAF